MHKAMSDSRNWAVIACNFVRLDLIGNFYYSLSFKALSRQFSITWIFRKGLVIATIGANNAKGKVPSLQQQLSPVASTSVHSDIPPPHSSISKARGHVRFTPQALPLYFSILSCCTAHLRWCFCILSFTGIPMLFTLHLDISMQHLVLSWCSRWKVWSVRLNLWRCLS